MKYKVGKLNNIKEITTRIVPLFPLRSLKREEANNLLNGQIKLIREEVIDLIKILAKKGGFNPEWICIRKLNKKIDLFKYYIYYDEKDGIGHCFGEGRNEIAQIEILINLFDITEKDLKVV
jgi:hypothetical protein